MNICLVSRELYPFQKSGIAVYIYNLAKNLSTHGHQVFIITDLHEGIKEFDIHKRVQIVTVDFDQKIFYELFENFNLCYSYAVYQALKNLVIKAEIDIVEFSDYFGESYFALLYKRYYGEFMKNLMVLKLHTPSYECNMINEIYPLENDITWQEDYCIKNIDCVYAISHSMKKMVQKRLDIDNIDVIYNFTGMQKQQINLLENQANTNIKKVLYVGRMEVRKGVDLLVRAAVKLLEKRQDLEFIFIGKDMPYSESFPSMKKYLISSIPIELQKHFVFLDPIGREQLAEYYSTAYISVFPSRWEGFGNVCIEAMTCGSPVIVSDAGGMMEIIDKGKAGLFFESGNEESLIEALKKVIDDLGFREELRLKGLKRAEYFSDDVLYKEQLNFYNKILDRYAENDYFYKKDLDKNKLIVKNWLTLVRKSETFLKEVLKVTKEWNKASEENQKLQVELTRVIQEWKLLSNSNKVIVSEFERVAKDNEKISMELQRMSKEWSSLADYNERISIELQRVYKEWEIIRKKNEQLAEENKQLTEENKQLIEKNIQVESQLNDLKTKVSSRKWMLAQILRLRKGDSR